MWAKLDMRILQRLALKWLQSFKEPEGQVARWLETLAQYDYAQTEGQFIL